MSDLIKKLQAITDESDECYTTDLCHEAADALEAKDREIEELADIVEVHIGGIDALQQRIAELEDALKWIDFNTIDVGARRVCKEALKEQDE